MELDKSAIVLESSDGTIVGWDAAASDVLGYATSEIIGQPLGVLFSPPATPEMSAVFEARATRALLTKAGLTLLASWQRTPIPGDDGRVLAVCHRFIPLPAGATIESPGRGAAAASRAESLESMRAERDHLWSLMQTAPGALVSFQMLPDGRPSFPFMSEGAARLFGFSAAQLRLDAELVFARIHPDDVARVYETHERAARTDSAWRCEFRYRHPDHGERWVVGNSLRMPEPKAAVVFSGIFFDITRRRQIEDNLALAEAQLRSALEAAEMGAWVFDAETGKMWANRSQRELWQTPQDAPHWFDVAISHSRIHEDDRERARAALAQALTGEPMRNEFRIVRADGSVRWIAARARGEGQIGPARFRRVAGVNIDITQQKLSTEKLQRSQKLEALGTLAGGIAHDFNNMLFAILGNVAVALAVKKAGGGDTRPMLLEVEVAARRAVDLVRQIVAFSRPDDQQSRVIDLQAAVRDALKLVRATTPSMIEMLSDFHPATPPVRADVSRVGQIVINLCTNAVHAIGKGRAGLVHVRLMPIEVTGQLDATAPQVPSGRYALLSVSDNGSGMDDAILPRIFDPFFTTKPPGEGTGLGLSVVHGIMKAFGAHIAVSSQPGKGTTFRLFFPQVDELPLPTQPPSEPSSQPRGKGQRILFVDDEPMLVRLATTLLTRLGYTPSAHHDPQRALEEFRTNPNGYALVITDLAMPSLSGFELARAVLEVRKDIPIVLMSGNLGPEERAVAQTIGIRETLLKPPNLDLLADLLARLS